VLFILTLPATAFAAGPYVGDIDAVAIGQGGAYIASPDSLSAFWYNPAALAGQQGLRLQLEGGFAFSDTSFARAPNPDGTQFLPVTSNQAQAAIFAGVTYDFGIPDLAIGAAFWSPQSNHIVYPDLGAQRYQSIYGGNYVFFMHIAAAYRIFKIVSLGATFGNTYFSTEQKLAVAAAIPGTDPEDTSFMVPLDIKVEDPFTITSNFGLRVEPLRWLAIGASVTPAYQINASGTIALTVPPALNGLTVNGNKISLQVTMPTIVRAGVRFHPLERLALEAAFVCETWSNFKTVTLQPNITVNYPPLGVSNQPIPTLKLPRNYKDTYSVRLGGEMKVLPFLVARLGFNVETSATSTAYYDVSTPDALKYMGSAGLSAHIWKFWIDVAYAHIFSGAVQITDSRQALTNLAPVQNAPTAIVGNGTANFSYDILHFGLRANFFDAPKLASASEPSTTPAP
jgi:long-chain fatty acid transport protein